MNYIGDGINNLWDFWNKKQKPVPQEQEEPDSLERDIKRQYGI